MRALLIAVALAGLATIGGGTAAAAPERSATAEAAAAAKCTKGACARRRARKLFSNRVFIRFTETGSKSSLDQRLHLCRDGSYVYDSVSYIPGVEPDLDQVIRVTGTWRVTKARMNRRGNRGSARVRGENEDGAGTITIRWNPSQVRVDGLDAIVQSSDLC